MSKNLYVEKPWDLPFLRKKPFDGRRKPSDLHFLVLGN
jgi:hypothetical protein